MFLYRTAKTGDHADKGWPNIPLIEDYGPI